jgi:cell division protein FtsB
MMMGTRQRRRILQILGPVAAAALVAYFAYYTVEGDRGLLALTRLQAKASNAEIALAQLKNQRDALELKVTSLRPNSLDIDRLDERTRTLLNDSQPNELIVILPNRPSPSH